MPPLLPKNNHKYNIVPRKLIFICIIYCVFFLASSVNAQNLQVYSNQDWHFQINIPPKWHFAEANQLVEQSDKAKQHQKSDLIKGSGLIVNISKFPFNQKIDFNPNINISAKNIEISPKLNTVQLVDYAKQILFSLVQQKEKLDVKDVKFNKLVGAETAYEYQLSNNSKMIDIFALTTVLVDKQTNNYFIIVASCPKGNSSEYQELFEQTIRTFKLF